MTAANQITSRVARKPIVIPKGVTVTSLDNSVTIKGPKGSTVLNVHSSVKLNIENDTIKIEMIEGGSYTRSGSGSRLKRSITGTTRASIASLIEGVSAGFERKLVLVGVGYRAQSQGSSLTLTVGHSHPDVYPIPQGITIETPTPTEIIVRGSDNQLVGKVCSEIREFRPPEPYKGKGIRGANEIVIRKETKKK
jgi:large subunit ribosomal protein L6